MINTLIHRLDQIIQPARVNHVAKETGWCKRKGKVSPFEFLYSVTWGQSSALAMTLSAQAACLSKPVTRQALDQRYTPEAVRFFKAVFLESLANSLTRPPESAMTQLLHQKFSAIRIFDSTHCTCSDALAKIFPASGGGGGDAGLKVLLSYEYGASQLQPLVVLPGKCSDQGLAQTVSQQVREKELGISDKGFYQAKGLREIGARGGYFLQPWPHGVSVCSIDAEGKRHALDVAAQLKVSTDPWVEWAAVELGKTDDSRLGPVRLIAFRLSEEKANGRRAQLREKYRTQGRQPTVEALELAGWLILLTNAPAELLPTVAVGYLYRVRWQVELIFKQWKSVLRLDVIPSSNVYRVQCEVWARLLAAVLAFVWHQHANAAALDLHQREISFSKLAKQLQQQGRSLVQALFGDQVQLHCLLRSIWEIILKLARKEHGRTRQTTWQNLRTHWLDLLPAKAAEATADLRPAQP